ncbi:hypothetical protein BKA56DRAFT_594234 [Ilyonectria sp. MPI-CAGE-AT-0026]|nr:hypothetical protein BKA56DRAFT_594234 [Ilyonectria sp. MPI-CAGE-AT-0026]
MLSICFRVSGTSSRHIPAVSRRKASASSTAMLPLTGLTGTPSCPCQPRRPQRHDLRARRLQCGNWGQGIALNPKAIKILDSIGFDRDRAGGVRTSGYRSCDKDGRMRVDFEVDFVARYGADILTFKRSDFREEFKSSCGWPPPHLTSQRRRLAVWSVVKPSYQKDAKECSVAEAWF